MRRGWTVTVQCQDSNDWTIKVQCLLMNNFDGLRGRTGFTFLKELVALCISFPTRPISLETEFHNSRYK